MSSLSTTLACWTLQSVAGVWQVNTPDFTGDAVRFGISNWRDEGFLEDAEQAARWRAWVLAHWYGPMNHNLGGAIFGEAVQGGTSFQFAGSAQIPDSMTLSGEMWRLMSGRYSDVDAAVAAWMGSDVCSPEPPDPSSSSSSSYTTSSSSSTTSTTSSTTEPYTPTPDPHTPTPEPSPDLVVNYTATASDLGNDQTGFSVTLDNNQNELNPDLEPRFGGTVELVLNVDFMSFDSYFADNGFTLNLSLSEEGALVAEGKTSTIPLPVLSAKASGVFPYGLAMTFIKGETKFTVEHYNKTRSDKRLIAAQLTQDDYLRFDWWSDLVASGANALRGADTTFTVEQAESSITLKLGSGGQCTIYEQAGESRPLPWGNTTAGWARGGEILGTTQYYLNENATGFPAPVVDADVIVSNAGNVVLNCSGAFAEVALSGAIFEDLQDARVHLEFDFTSSSDLGLMTVRRFLYSDGSVAEFQGLAIGAFPAGRVDFDATVSEGKLAVGDPEIRVVADEFKFVIQAERLESPSNAFVGLPFGIKLFANVDADEIPEGTAFSVAPMQGELINIWNFANQGGNLLTAYQGWNSAGFYPIYKGLSGTMKETEGTVVMAGAFNLSKMAKPTYDASKIYAEVSGVEVDGAKMLRNTIIAYNETAEPQKIYSIVDLNTTDVIGTQIPSNKIVIHVRDGGIGERYIVIESNSGESKKLTNITGTLWTKEVNDVAQFQHYFEQPIVTTNLYYEVETPSQQDNYEYFYVANAKEAEEEIYTNAAGMDLVHGRRIVAGGMPTLDFPAWGGYLPAAAAVAIVSNGDDGFYEVTDNGYTLPVGSDSQVLFGVHNMKGDESKITPIRTDTDPASINLAFSSQPISRLSVDVLMHPFSGCVSWWQVPSGNNHFKPEEQIIIVQADKGTLEANAAWWAVPQEGSVKIELVRDGNLWKDKSGQISIECAAEEVYPLGFAISKASQDAQGLVQLTKPVFATPGGIALASMGEASSVDQSAALQFPFAAGWFSASGSYALTNALYTIGTFTESYLSDQSLLTFDLSKNVSLLYSHQVGHENWMLATGSGGWWLLYLNLPDSLAQKAELPESDDGKTFGGFVAYELAPLGNENYKGWIAGITIASDNTPQSSWRRLLRMLRGARGARKAKKF